MSDFNGVPGVVLVGTDTGVGKTTTATALLRLAHRLGLRPVPFKPAETGITNAPTDDSARLLAASGRLDLTIADVCPHRFAPPVAPALAARQSGAPLDPTALVQAARGAAARGNFLLVETAGGLLSPYAPRFTAADLAAALAPLPILLVARNGLGTVNHTALALNELERRALPCAGLFLVDTVPGDTPDRAHNAALIVEQTGVAPLATLPFVPDACPDRLADALAAQLPPRALFARFGAAPPE